MTSRPPGADLNALLAAVRRSPIVVRLSSCLLGARQWARIRRSPEVDAYVLAWIASHRRDRPHRPRPLM